jgi:GntR family transcriptional regulator
MQVNLDFRSKIPIYVQIIDQIKDLIAVGVLHPGDQLPTVRQLAADLRVNFNTVARAYRLLDEAGVISTQQGRGTYALERLPAEKAAGLRQTTLEAMARSFVSDAGRRRYSPDEVIAAVETLVVRWKKDGKPPMGGDA